MDLGLGYIKALRPVYYRWDKRAWYPPFNDGIENDEERDLYMSYKPDGSKKRDRWEIGLLAQEALTAEKAHTDKEQCRNEKQEPDKEKCDEGIVVSGTNKYGYRIINENLTMPLIKAVQELGSCIDAKIDSLTTRVTALE